MQVFSDWTATKNSLHHLFFFLEQGSIIKLCAKKGVRVKGSSAEPRHHRGRSPTGSPSRLSIQSQAAPLYIDPSGDCCGWRRTAFEWMALCVAARGKREANKRQKYREGKLCDLDVKTDRRLMGSSIFRCSDEALEHAGLKYLWIEFKKMIILLFFAGFCTESCLCFIQGLNTTVSHWKYCYFFLFFYSVK